MSPELRQSYAKTIPDKIALLSSLIKAVQQDPTDMPLRELRNAVHKIAGSAGSYDFGTVTKLCKEMDLQLADILAAGATVDTVWLSKLDQFLDNVKQAFQGDMYTEKD